MPSKVPGLGSLLKRGGTLVAQRVEIMPPEFSAGTREVTDLASNIIERLPVGIADCGTLSLKIFYDPAESGHTAMRDEVLTPPRGIASTHTEYIVEFNDGDPTATPAVAGHKVTFKGFCTKFATNGLTVDGTVGADVEITVSTKPTFS
jgi:hypothetical protein